MKNQKGFALVESIVVLLVCAMIAGAGWYVWHSKHNEHDGSANKPATQQVATPAGAFTGTVEFDQCSMSHNADGGCSIVVHNKSIQIVAGNVSHPNGWGKLIGFEALQDIKGRSVEVYANQLGSNTYDLSGEQYYVKLLN